MLKTFVIFSSIFSILISCFNLRLYFAERNLKQGKSICKYCHNPDSTSIPWKFIDLAEKPRNRPVEFWGEIFTYFARIGTNWKVI